MKNIPNEILKDMMNGQGYKILGTKLIKNDVRLFDKVVGHRQLKAENGYTATFPVIKRMDSKEVMEMVLAGIVSLAITYITVVAIVVLAPCSPM